MSFSKRRAIDDASYQVLPSNSLRYSGTPRRTLDSLPEKAPRGSKLSRPFKVEAGQHLQPKDAPLSNQMQRLRVVRNAWTKESPNLIIMKLAISTYKRQIDGFQLLIWQES